jgi:uncharacterized protein YciI
MLFHVRMMDYPVTRRTAALRAVHWQYLDDNADIILARGPTQNDEGTLMRSSLFFIDVADRAAAERFAAEEPYNKAGAFMNTEIFRWNNALGRRQKDFQRKEGQTYWYMRGYAKPGAHHKREALLATHKAFLEPYDADFIVRGSVRNEQDEWVGSVTLVTLPDRKTAEAFAAEEPFCKNGLFERIVIERYKLGGRPGQIT